MVNKNYKNARKKQTMNMLFFQWFGDTTDN